MESHTSICRNVLDSVVPNNPTDLPYEPFFKDATCSRICASSTDEQLSHSDIAKKTGLIRICSCITSPFYNILLTNECECTSHSHFKVFRTKRSNFRNLKFLD